MAAPARPAVSTKPLYYSAEVTKHVLDDAFIMRVTSRLEGLDVARLIAVGQTLAKAQSELETVLRDMTGRVPFPIELRQPPERYTCLQCPGAPQVQGRQAARDHCKAQHKEQKG